MLNILRGEFFNIALKAGIKYSCDFCNISGKFIGSTTFWIYVLLGEFVLLLVCFDSMLYCKQMGVMYKLTRNCRKGKTMQVNSEAASEEKSQNEIKGS